MPISEGYGREGDRWYVNSAQSWSKDKVDDWFQEEMDERGSVPLRFIETLVSGADLPGRWAIRSYIQAKGFSRQSALTIMGEIDMPDVKGIPYMWKVELDDYLDARKAARHEGQLERAAALNRRPVQIWHGLPCKPPGDEQSPLPCQ